MVSKHNVELLTFCVLRYYTYYISEYNCSRQICFSQDIDGRGGDSRRNEVNETTVEKDKVILCIEEIRSG